MKKMIAIISAAMLAACGGSDGDPSGTTLLSNAGTSTGNGSNPSTGANGSQASTDAQGQQDGSVLPTDEFLRSEFLEGSGEILLSRLALERATSAEVRQFAQLMIDHHTQANAEIQALAGERNISLSNETGAEYQSRLNAMQQLSGEEFDRAYMNHNVAVHDAEVGQYVATLMAALNQNGGSTAGGATPGAGGTATGNTGTTSGATSGSTTGNASGGATGNASGGATGNTSGGASGNTTGNTTGNATGNASGSPTSTASASSSGTPAASGLTITSEAGTGSIPIGTGATGSGASGSGASGAGGAAPAATGITITNEAGTGNGPVGSAASGTGPAGTTPAAGTPSGGTTPAATGTATPAATGTSTTPAATGTTSTPAATGTTTGATPAASGTNQSGATPPAQVDTEMVAFLGKMKAVMAQHLGMAKAVNGAINPSAWLMNVYQDGLAEIRLSTIALERAQNAEVRRYAQMMIDEHTRANNEISQVAQAKGVTLPSTVTSDQRAAAEELEEMEGARFDKAFMNHNVIVHALSVRQTEAQASGGSDPDVQALAARTLPHLQTHLQEATQIYQALPNDLLLGAWADGLGEILMSSLAVQRAADTEVRQYAQRMIDDHTQANLQLANLADERDVFLPLEPSAETALAFMEASRLTGAAFDRAYMESNVAVHQKGVALFTDRSQNEPDQELRAFAAQTLPVLSAHLQEATRLRDRVAAAAAGADAAGGTNGAGTGAATGATGGTGGTAGADAGGASGTGGATGATGASGATPAAGATDSASASTTAS